MESIILEENFYMKKLIAILILLSNMCFSQFKVTDFLFITKINHEQIEEKFSMKLERFEKTKLGTEKYYYKFNDMNSDFTLMIDESKGKMNYAEIYAPSGIPNDIFGNLKFAFNQTRNPHKFAVINNKTLKEIPYFTMDEFDSAIYPLKEKLVGKTAIVVYFIKGIYFTLSENGELFKINAKE